jgi:hypothetical protein
MASLTVTQPLLNSPENLLLFLTTFAAGWLQKPESEVVYATPYFPGILPSKCGMVEALESSRPGCVTLRRLPILLKAQCLNLENIGNNSTSFAAFLRGSSETMHSPLFNSL